MERPDNVPYIVFESEQARHERNIKRLVIALVISIALIFISNMFWLYEWTQYDYESETTTYTQDGQGVNLIGSSNEVYHGTDPDYQSTKKETQNKEW